MGNLKQTAVFVCVHSLAYFVLSDVFHVVFSLKIICDPLSIR